MAGWLQTAIRRYGRQACALLAAWPVLHLPGPRTHGADAAIRTTLEPAPIQRWSPSELPEQLIQLLPGDTLEGVARTLVEQRIQVQLDRDKAFVQVRIPLG